MRISEALIDQIEEDYCYYLETLDPDVCPMTLDTYECLRLRDMRCDEAELQELYLY